MIDYDKYSVDLLLFQNIGVFCKQIPAEVNILYVEPIQVLFQSFANTLKMKNRSLKNIVLAVKRYIVTLIGMIRWKQFDQIRIHRWIDYYSKYIPENSKKYDVGVAYSGGETSYYLFDKVTCCRKKVCFFHNDYSQIDIDINVEEQYVKKADLIVTISDACLESLKELFPKYNDKMIALQNPSSPRLIKKMSEDFYPKEYKKDDCSIKIISVGRLHPQKGYDMAVKAAHILKEKKIDFKWYVVGEGQERKSLEKEIAKYDLEDRFLLLGIRENPYPYICNADILIQPSRYEGKSVVLDEAKVLGIPIVVTNYNSVEDQIKNGINGLIVEMTPEGLSEGIEELIQNPLLQKYLRDNLEKELDGALDNIDYYLNVICE